jgi:hypothetical protein
VAAAAAVADGGTAAGCTEGEVALLLPKSSKLPTAGCPRPSKSCKAATLLIQFELPGLQHSRSTAADAVGCSKGRLLF